MMFEVVNPDWELAEDADEASCQFCPETGRGGGFRSLRGILEPILRRCGVSIDPTAPEIEGRRNA